MGQKGIVFTTGLSVKECADIFRTAGDATRGVKGKIFETVAGAMGNGAATGYYTPTFDSPFASVDGVPDFAIGINILKFNGGGQGNGTHVHMYVDDRGGERSVQLVSQHGLLGGARSARMTRKFLEHFQAADQRLAVTDGNL
ncbi:hypothetical protein ACI78T_06745 [Blastococcus sp. SYSU D00922]